MFSRATKWKAYWRSLIREYVRGDVLEVGAGIGTNTTLLRSPDQSRWVCLEPDKDLALRLSASVRRLPGHLPCEIEVATVSALAGSDMFDSILYIDVLEHIAGDVEELAAASRHLEPDGTLVVLAPAHQRLFTPFDRAIGHHRRYNARTLAACGPDELELERLIYLDAAGLIVSMANRFLLKQSMPTKRQIWVWDKCVIPVSRLLDPVLCYKAGKSLLAIWRRPAATGGGRRRVRSPGITLKGN